MEKAAQWADDIYWNEYANVSRATGSEFARETLYRTAGGSYWILRTEPKRVDVWMDVNEDWAFAWLLDNEHDDSVPVWWLDKMQIL